MSDPFIGRQFGDYVVQELLGRGGMARVYKGYDSRLQRYAAVKIINSELVASADQKEYTERFQREARSIAKLNHPNIVGVYQFGEYDQGYYMAMVFIEGRDLRQILRDYNMREERMPLPDILNVVHGIAHALDYAHSRGVIHRDIKPSNIMINADNQPVLTDFGLALSASEGTMGDTFGSAHYIAPEQAVSSAKAVPQSDLYSLGICAYEMLTGRVPFDDPSAMSVALKHLNDPPPPLRDIVPSLSQEIEAVVLKALEKDPEARFPTGAMMVQALNRAITLGATKPPVPEVVAPGVASPSVARPFDTQSKPVLTMVESSPSTPTVPMPPDVRRGVPPALLIGVVLVIAVVLLVIGIQSLQNRPAATTATPVIAVAVVTEAATSRATNATSAASTTSATSAVTALPTLAASLNATSASTDAATPSATLSTPALIATGASTARATDTLTPTLTDTLTQTSTASSTATDTSTPTASVTNPNTVKPSETTPAPTTPPITPPTAAPVLTTAAPTVAAAAETNTPRPSIETPTKTVTQTATKTVSPTSVPVASDTPTETIVPILTGDLLMEWDEQQFDLVNIGTRTLNLTGMQFVQTHQFGERRFEAERWDIESARYKPYAMPSGWCFQINRGDLGRVVAFKDCARLSGYVTLLDTSRWFWVPANSTAEAIDVYIGERKITSCQIAIGKCTFSLP